jgi:hypothetical protein
LGKLTDKINTLRSAGIDPNKILDLLVAEDVRPARRSAKQIGYSTEFETFWRMYPDKSNNSKPNAFIEWQKLTDEYRTLALGALIPFGRFLKKPNAPSCVHAERFLRDERFLSYADQAGANVVHLKPTELDDTHPGRFLAKCRAAGVREAEIRKWWGQFTVSQVSGKWSFVVDGDEVQFNSAFHDQIEESGLMVYNSFRAKRIKERESREG